MSFAVSGVKATFWKLKLPVHFGVPGAIVGIAIAVASPTAVRADLLCMRVPSRWTTCRIASASNPREKGGNQEVERDF
jgi:hypothetical protein